MLIAFTITTQAQNKLLSSIDEYYSGTWQTEHGTNYEYDSNNKLTAETRLNWDSNTNTWKISEKTTYTYNSSDKVTEEFGQVWNNANNTYENGFKTTNTYTAGKITEISSFVWENANWFLEFKFEFTYNTNNLPISSIFTSFSNGFMQERSTVTYNDNNTIQSSLSEVKDGAEWVNERRTQYTYNANDKLIAEKSEEWNAVGNVWIDNGDKIEYQWDQFGNQTQEVEYYTLTGLQSRYKNVYTYDTSNLMSNFAHPFKDKTGLDYLFNDFPYVNKVQVENSYNYNVLMQEFQQSNRTTYNYSTAISLSTATIEKEIATVAVYPNPTKDFLNIENPSNLSIDKVFVTDMTGKKVIEQSNASAINVQNLAKGIYVLELYSGKEKLQSKFIKE